MSQVLIVNMPFSNLRWPNLGPSLLKAALGRRGIACDMAYWNFDFAERVGLDRYQWLADRFAFVLGGERLFAKEYFRTEEGLGRLPDDESYLRDVLLNADPDLTETDFRDYLATEEHVRPFLDACMAGVDWADYAIVGFATTFQQTMPSMCLARRIQRLRPEIKIVFGGAACEGPMGIELARRFPEIDYVFLGEADLTFPPLVEQILEGTPVTLPPGVVGVARSERSDGRGGWSVSAVSRSPDRDTGPTEGLPNGRRPSVAGPAGSGDPRRAPALADKPPVAPDAQSPDSPGCAVQNLDDLPYPDFDDYFARLKSSPVASQIEPLLFFETSRGCWWGQKHHCAFCGLNGASLAFRSKTPRRAVDELKWMVERYGVRRGCAADNIFAFRYFDTFLPMLKEAELGLGFVFEMKTNLARGQVEKLLDAGLGAAQLGIESFITPVLKLIGKGANALQNLQTLKWFSEAGIEVKWNFLYGFPGEDPAGYAELLDLLPSLVHLAPPLAVGRVRLDRFSPYFADPAGWGMANPRPNRAFAYVYPFPEETLARMAYYYEYDYADGRNPRDYAGPVLEALETWRQLQGTVTLRAWDRPDGVLLLTDTRPCAAAFQRRLTGLERQVYLHCDTGRTLEDVVAMAASSVACEPSGPEAIGHMLDGWIADRLMARLDRRYLSLALRARSNLGDH